LRRWIHVLKLSVRLGGSYTKRKPLLLLESPECTLLTSCELWDKGCWENEGAEAAHAAGLQGVTASLPKGRTRVGRACLAANMARMERRKCHGYVLLQEVLVSDKKNGSGYASG
jgi:hypothetical protein